MGPEEELMSVSRLVGRPSVCKPIGRIFLTIEPMESRLLLSGGAAALKIMARPAAHVAALHHSKVHPAKVVHHKLAHTKPAAHSKPTKKPGKSSKAGSVIQPVAIVSAGPMASPLASPSSVPSPGQPPFTPAEIRHFYGVDTLNLNGISGDGRGQTIAIIDAYSSPKLLNTTDPNFATSNNDLYTFDKQFGLPDPPSFLKINQNGGTTLPTTYNSGWSIESSLDVEWAHAMAPAANILLVEANSPSNSDLMNAAVNTARNYPGVVAISMSWGETEFSGENSYDSLFTTPSGHAGVTFLAAVGDDGASATNYPAFSPNVVAVGGTAITTSDSSSDYGSESVWNDSYGSTGGNISTFETKPSYQVNVTQSSTMRTVPDVSFDAAVTSGVYVLDTSQSGGGGYYEVGGTSLSTPCWAGLIAIADQGRAQLSLGSLDGPTQTLPRIYQLASGDFHDVVTGNNGFNGNAGFSAAPGYDLATGLGTPVANRLVPDLAGGATLSGQAFQDNNANGVFDGTDAAWSGKTVYLDLNNLGHQIPTDPTTTTNASGNFTFTDIIGDTGTVRLVSAPSGYAQVGTGAFTTSFGSASTDNLAFFPTVYSDAGSNQTYTLRISPSLSSQVQVLVNGAVTYSAPVALASSFAFNLNGASDQFIVDGSNGNPLPSGGAAFNGGSLANGDTLSAIGSNGNDTFVVNAGSILFGSNPITFSNTSNLLIDPRGGSDNLTVNSGSVTLPAQTPGAGILVRTFTNLNVAGGASVKIANAAAHSDRTLIVAANLSINSKGQLDLGGNDMIVHNGNLSTITALLAGGFAGGSWNGLGIDSAAAHADPRFLTALGVLSNNSNGNPIYNTFDGQAAVAGDVLVKYTYYGDADLSGTVDGTDYSLIDHGISTPGATGWVNGDFNYDGLINGSDYSLIDNAFNMQTTTL